MKIGAGSVGRVLCSAFLLVGLGVEIPPVAASAAPAAPGPQRQPAQQQPAKRQPAKPKTRKLAVDPREHAWRSHLVAHPVPAPRATAPSVSAAKERQLRAAAAQQAVQRASDSTCSGQIDADTLISCQNPSATGTDTYTLTLPAGANVLVFQTSFEGFPQITVTAPDSTTVSCKQTPFFRCATSQSGTYTVAVASNQSTYTLEFTPLLSESNCPALSLSFAAAPVQGTLTAGETGDCYSVSASSGDNLYAFGVQLDQRADKAIFDADGNLVCEQTMGSCALTGTGPYRVLASSFGQAESYAFQIADLTDPAGCAEVAQQSYGDVPAPSADPCSSLTVTTAARYQIYSMDSQFSTQPGTLYAADGTPACTGTGLTCQLAPGTYSFVQSFLPDGTEVSTTFLSGTRTQGCVSASDTSFASGDATGSFTGPGEEACRSLPTKAGLSDYLYSQPVSSGTQAQVLGVVDATGAPVCPDAFEFWSFATCTLTGTAPFRVLLVPAGADSQFRLLAQRTGSTAGCGAWPQSAYGNAAGAHVRLTKTDNARCLVIPPAGRAAAELVEDADATDGAEAALVVSDPSGQILCQGNGFPTDWTICHYKAGVSYTAILVDTLSRVSQDTYELARRDMTGKAACSAPASTTPGGPPTSFVLGSSVAAHCVQVSAATTDKLLFNLRASAPADPTVFQVPSATMVIANDAGTEDCGFTFVCPATGSTKFQAIVLTIDYTDVGIAAHFDTWRVGTSAGWAAPCKKHSFSTSTTSAAVSDTLTDSSDLYCGVVNIQSDRSYSITGSDTAIAASTSNLLVNVFPASFWASQSQFGLCGDSGNDWCQIGGIQPPKQALLIVTQFADGQYPVTFDMQGVCGGLGCTNPLPPVAIKSISPASQPAGPSSTVVLTGTGLAFGMPVDLIDETGPGFEPTVSSVAVNAAGTRLTVRLDTSRVTPGLTYDVTSGGSCSPPPCSGDLVHAYTVTKAPAPAPATKFVPLTARRIEQASVKAHGTLTFPVTGHADVPAAGVATVTLDVSAVSPSSPGSLTVFAAGSKRPPAETVDFSAGKSMTGLVTVPVVGGRVSVYNGSPAKVSLTADVLGYSSAKPPTAGTGFTTVGPVRILNPTGVNAGHAHVLTVAGAGGIPKTGTQAVALDVTVTAPAKAGHLIAYPDGTSRPAVTSLSFAAGQQVTDLVIAKVTNGKVDLYDSSAGSLKLTVDAVGYYSTGGWQFRPVNEQRVMDTRTGFGGVGPAILPHTASKFSPLWKTIVPAKVAATAVVLNVTVLNAKSAGALTAFPDSTLYEDGVTLPNSTSLPGTPNVAFAAGQTQSNLVIVPPSGIQCLYNGSNSNLSVVVDVEGYYTN